MTALPSPLKSCLHAHSAFDDGSLTPDEMVEAALHRGFEVLGLSGHAWMGRPEDWTMSQEGTGAFVREMGRLKEKYSGRIAVYCGIEQDVLAPPPAETFDYVIGACHAVQVGDALIYADFTPEHLEEGVSRYFCGDIYAFIRAYFETAAQIGRAVPCDFVAHFDLVAKYNAGGRLFDEEDPRYRTAALEALSAVMEKVRVFEINTGGMYRAGRAVPYPAPFLLREIYQKGGEILLTSDSHDARSLGYRYGEAAELARSIGFRYAKVLTPEGLVDAPL